MKNKGYMLSRIRIVLLPHMSYLLVGSPALLGLLPLFISSHGLYLRKTCYRCLPFRVSGSCLEIVLFIQVQTQQWTLVTGEEATIRALTGTNSEGQWSGKAVPLPLWGSDPVANNTQAKMLFSALKKLVLYRIWFSSTFWSFRTNLNIISNPKKLDLILNANNKTTQSYHTNKKTTKKFKLFNTLDAS